MDKVQFHHSNNHGIGWQTERYTMAVDVPPASDLLDLMSFGSKDIVLQVGHTIVHPKDNYNKKTGRSLSRERLAPQKYQLRIVKYKDEKTVDLYFYCDKITSEVVFQIAFGQAKAYFIRGY